MNALESIQISTNTLRETLKGGERGATGDGKAFLESLLESEFAVDGEITGEELVAFLESRGGKDLPALGQLLPVILQTQGGEGDGEDLPDFAEQVDEDPEALVAGLMAMIEGRQQTDARVGGSAGVENFLKQGTTESAKAAQLREALSQGMAAARMAAEAKVTGEPKGDDFQNALQRLGSNGLTAQSQSGINTPAPRQMPTMQVNTPLGQPGWGQAVGDKLTWMARQDVQQARIQLNPPGMGPMEVSVNIQDDKASINFSALNAATREALQAELPRLRTMMNDNGFDAVDVNVEQDADRDGYESAEQRFAEADGNDRYGDGDEAGDEGAVPEAGQDRTGVGLIDHYA